MLEEMVLVKIDFNFLRGKPAGDKDPPDPRKGKDETRTCRSLKRMARDTLAPNINDPAANMTPARGIEGTARYMNDDVELLEEADNEEHAADKTRKPATRKSVAGDISESTGQGNVPTKTAPDHDLRGTAGQGCF